MWVEGGDGVELEAVAEGWEDGHPLDCMFAFSFSFSFMLFFSLVSASMSVSISASAFAPTSASACQLLA